MGNRNIPWNDGNVVYLDYINVKIPIVILYASFARYYHWQNWAKSELGFCINSYNCIWNKLSQKHLRLIKKILHNMQVHLNNILNGKIVKVDIIG